MACATSRWRDGVGDAAADEATRRLPRLLVPWMRLCGTAAGGAVADVSAPKRLQETSAAVKAVRGRGSGGHRCRRGHGTGRGGRLFRGRTRTTVCGMFLADEAAARGGGGGQGVSWGCHPQTRSLDGR